MDTSKEYIEMCEKAYDLQEKHNFSYKGDWFHHIKDIILVCNADVKMKPGTWLPRQDQLQKMVDLKKIGYTFEEGFAILWDKDFGYMEDDEKEISYYKNFDSFEKKWLAFVMREKHNKIWDNEGKCWSKEDEIWNNKNKK